MPRLQYTEMVTHGKFQEFIRKAFLNLIKVFMVSTTMSQCVGYFEMSALTYQIEGRDIPETILILSD
jgi:hypothetical protein